MLDDTIPCRRDRLKRRKRRQNGAKVSGQQPAQGLIPVSSLEYFVNLILLPRKVCRCSDFDYAGTVHVLSIATSVAVGEVM